MAVRVSPEEFDDLVDRALEQIPSELLDQVENCAIVIEDHPGPGQGRLLGLYEGIPLSARDSSYAGVLPDRITLFREPIVSMCRTRDEVVEQVRITVWHELAHYFGIDDDDLDEWGYG